MSLKSRILILSLFLQFHNINSSPLNSLYPISQSSDPCDLSEGSTMKKSPLLLYSPKNSVLYFICNGKIVSSKFISNKKLDWGNNYSNLIEMDNYGDYNKENSLNYLPDQFEFTTEKEYFYYTANPYDNYVEPDLDTAQQFNFPLLALPNLFTTTAKTTTTVATTMAPAINGNGWGWGWQEPKKEEPKKEEPKKEEKDTYPCKGILKDKYSQVMMMLTAIMGTVGLALTQSLLGGMNSAFNQLLTTSLTSLAFNMISSRLGGSPATPAPATPAPATTTAATTTTVAATSSTTVSSVNVNNSTLNTI